MRSSRNAANATRALNAGLWVRRVRRPDAFILHHQKLLLARPLPVWLYTWSFHLSRRVNLRGHFYRALLSVLDWADWAEDAPRLVTGSLGRQLNGHWSTTNANAWGVSAMKKFSTRFEAIYTPDRFAELPNDRLLVLP